ncbi:DUF2147 domain-containing protein [Sandaracinobacteroides hominis]|uniref:DUF2147 domain-containing protein n=1 Tax=Sandaracinobacteroides hominis TaxID=2780086 RepID=UPI0018F42B46|nr:DUF2147 domain-containing protein [Sandaracinobacteroides hominis]
MRLTFLAAALLAASPVLAAKQMTPSGVWQSPGGNTRLRISKCGANICGKVAWASERAKADAARGGHPNLVGMQLFEDFSRTGANTFNGRVFVPDINRRFNGTLTMDSATSITVRGCLVRNSGCRSEVWTRVGN